MSKVGDIRFKMLDLSFQGPLCNTHQLLENAQKQ